MTELHGRLPWPGPDDLDPARRALYDSLTAGPRGSGPFPIVDEHGRLYGPFNAWILEPEVGTALADLGSALRYGGVLDDRLREVVICEVAVTLSSEFEWFAHAAMARTAGVAEEDLAAIHDGRDAPGLSAEERLARVLARSLVVRRDLDDEEYETAVATLGAERLQNVVVLAGFYAAIATILAAYRVPLPEGVDPVF